jgi:hypothetical protein
MLNLETYKLFILQIQKDLDKIKKEDKFLYYELENVYDIISLAPFPNNKILLNPLKYISYEENITLVNEFLNTISNTYKNNFQDLLNNNKVIFTKTKNSYCKHNLETKESLIIINETNTLLDSLYLVHEFLHTENISLSYDRVSFTETVSIIGELLYIEFLKEKSYSSYDLSILKEERVTLYKDYLKVLKSIIPFYINIRDNNVNNTYISNIYTKNKSNLINNCWNKNNNLNIYNYRYVLGYIFAILYCYNNKDNTNIVNINNAIIKDDTSTFLSIILGNLSKEELPKVLIKELNTI